MTTEEKITKNKLGLLGLAHQQGETFPEPASYSVIPDRASIAAVENAVRQMVIDPPAYGQQCAANELKKQEIFVSPLPPPIPLHPLRPQPHIIRRQHVRPVFQ